VSTFWPANYWPAEYWASNFWPVIPATAGGFWPDEFWPVHFWPANYWPLGISAPTLTSVNAGSALFEGATAVAYVGTHLGPTTGDQTLTVIQGAVSVTQTQDTASSTGGTFDVVVEPVGSQLKFGSGTFKVTITARGASASLPVTIDPLAGHLFVDVGTPDTTSSERITAIPDIASGDQIEARGAGGGATPTGLTINSDATFSFASGDPPTAFDVRIWDSSDATWGAWATQSVPGIVVDVPLATLTLSAPVPAVIATGPQLILVPVVGLVLSAPKPTVLLGNVTVAVPVANLRLTAPAPNIEIAANQVIAVPLAALTLSTPAPRVVAQLQTGSVASDTRYVVRRAGVRAFTVTSMSSRFNVKGPAERVPVTFDFTFDLPAGVTLTGAVTITVETIEGTDANPEDILNGGFAFDATSTKVIQPVQDGLDGCEYRIICTASTTQPTLKPTLTGILPVRANLN